MGVLMSDVLFLTSVFSRTAKLPGMEAVSMGGGTGPEVVTGVYILVFI